MPKFALVLTARYPSEKAYAVTTRETARAADEAGYQTLIFAPSGKPERNVVSIDSHAITLLTNFFGAKQLAIEKITFHLRRIVIAKEFRKLNRSDHNSRIIWTRDPIVALFVPRNQELVLELHHNPSKLDAQICKVLNLRRNLVISTLTKAHIDAIQPLFAKHRICLTPMAVNQEFFLNQDKFSSIEKIAFVGKGWSSGHDNNLLKIIHEIAFYKDKFGEELNLSFLGLEDDYQAKLRREIFNFGLKEERFGFISHINHREVPQFLKDVSIGLIPYEYTEYNNQRFPIKALEYAAARVTILATDIPIHKKILSDKFCYFYSPGVPGDLGRVLRTIFADSLARQVKIQRAEEWATSHTYRNRVNVILNALSEVRDGRISHE